MAASVEELRGIVDDNLRRAESIVDAIRLDENEKVAKSLVADLPRFRQFTVGSGASAWGAILFVDLRNSTRRAQSIGAKKTFLTMHALLPSLAYAVDAHGGYIVGFRGDGLFAIFGLNSNGYNEQNLDQGQVIAQASRCGQWMIESVAKVVNPALEARDCRGNLKVGIGIDSGTVVVTRIGFLYASEVTAYGNAVNEASKISDVSENQVIVSEEVDRLFPTSGTGKVKAVSVPGHSSYREIVFPRPLIEE